METRPTQALNSKSSRRTLLGGLIFFAAVAVYGSLTPLDYRPLPFSEAVTRFAETLSQPVAVGRRIDWAVNILLFVPLGFFLLGALSHGRTRWFQTSCLPFVALALALLSLLIEFSQLWFPPRVPSQNDVVAESIGGVLGCVLWIAFGETLAAAVSEFQFDHSISGRARRLFDAYAIAFAVYSLMPLDLTASLSELYEKVKLGRVTIVPFTYPYKSVAAFAWAMVSDVALLAPVGAAIALRFTRRTNWLWPTMGIGLAYLVMIETMQLLVFSRYTDATDIVTGAIGIVAGGALARKLLGESDLPPVAVAQRPSAGIWLVAALLIAAALPVVYWYPYDFHFDPAAARDRLDQFATALFEPMYRGGEFNALVGILRKSITFGLLSAILEVWVQKSLTQRNVRRVLSACCLLACFLLGVAIELGQVLLPDHTAHMTDVLLYAFGAIAGHLIVVSCFKATEQGCP